MLKKFSISLIVLSVALTILMFIPNSNASTHNCSHLKGCQKKFCEIENQLIIAQDKGNKGKEKGLRISLENAKEHCTDEGLKEKLIEKIDEIKKEITEYESDLKEAKTDEKKDKIDKYQEKIREEKAKIKNLEDELSTLN